MHRGRGDTDGLRKALEKGLADGEPEMTFAVHVQSDPKGQPVEDATQHWWNVEADPTGAKSAVPLADIRLHRLAGNSEDLAQHLVFSPWNVTEAHRPLGIMNRIRRQVYVRLAEERHRRNAPDGAPAPMGYLSAGSVSVPTSAG